MAVPLLMIGAVPFNLPRDSIASRRQRKIDNLDPQQMMVAQMVSQAVDAVQFVLGPRHRPAPTLPSSPTYKLPEKMIRCPPNTPDTKLSFDFDPGNEADADSSEAEDKNKPSLKIRKRKRVCSFSKASASSRRVPHKKPTVTQSTQTDEHHRGQDDIPDHSAALPRLQFYQDVQTAANINDQGVDEEKWKRLGSSLRTIADSLGHGYQQSGKKEQPSGTELMSDSVLSAVFKLLFWKFIRSFK